MIRLLTLFLFAGVCQAATPDRFDLRVTYGEKISSFHIVKDGKGATFTFQPSHGKKVMKKLTPSDTKFLFTRVQALPAQKSDGKCPRSHVEAHVKIDGKSSKTNACFFGKETPSAKLRALVDLLATFAS